MKTLIAYYSRAGENLSDGNIRTLTVGYTEIAARIVQRYTGGDLCPIRPVRPYSENFCECMDQSKQDLSRNILPHLSGTPIDLSGYGVIYLGYPNYWNTLPMPVVAFLEAHDLTGKIIRPFCTYEISGFGHSIRDLKRLCPGAEIREGLAVRGARVASEEETIAEWVSADPLPWNISTNDLRIRRNV